MIIERLVTTGIARYEFRQFPVLGERSVYAALATECAADQNEFWPLHDRFMANDRTLYTEGGLRRQAIAEGMDADALFECIRENAHLEAIQASRAEGQRRGVTATPTIFVNDVKVDPTLEAILAAVAQAGDGS